MDKIRRCVIEIVSYIRQMFFWTMYILAFLTLLTCIYRYNSKREVITVQYENELQRLDLESYIAGVVLSEMPASFADEALKAQAIAARTFALKVKNSNKHELFDICADSGCCQGYISKNNYLNMGGKIEMYQHIRKIVNATKNRVITYQGSLIEAPYFSCSGGRTESAVAVWGNDFPYLISKESPGEEEAKCYFSEYYFSDEEVREKLELASDCPVIPNSITYTAGKGVERISFGEREYSGTEFRSKMNLPSTMISLEPEEAGLFIQAKGFGHRVGLSQYGANAMADRGYRYNQILEYYYPGTKIIKLEQMKNGDE